jgi:peroxiredoxin
MDKRMMQWFAGVMLAGCVMSTPASAGLAESAQAVRPLKIGMPVPPVWLKTARGQSVDLHDSVLVMPTVLVFYRGGWCPYCTRQLADLQRVENRLREMGYQVIAISPDPPDVLRETIQKLRLGFTLLSDNEFLAAQAFGLAYEVNDETVEKYSALDIPLYSPGDSVVRALPVPATYLISPNGVIIFAHIDTDYTVRIGAEEIVAAAKSALTGP